MYVRYTQPPPDLFDWYEEYLCDEEEIDVKAGGGQITTIGSILRQWLVKLDWFSTLFPRIPVPVQKQIEQRLAEYDRINKTSDTYYSNRNDNYNAREYGGRSRDDSGTTRSFGEAERYARDRNERYNRERERGRERDIDRRDRDRYLDRDRSSRDYNERSREKERSRHKSEHSRHRSRSRERHRRHR